MKSETSGGLDTAAPGEPGAMEGEAGDGRAMGLRILVVDDSTVMRKVVARSVRIAGLEVREVMEAPNGVEALEQIRTRMPDLVFLDLHMPQMNGDSLLRVLRSDPRLATLPVVVVSSDGQSERVRRVLDMGGRFIAKPFTPQDLRTLFETMEEISDALGTGGAPGSGDGTDF